jgi:micrococcal nuclease
MHVTGDCSRFFKSASAAGTLLAMAAVCLGLAVDSARAQSPTTATVTRVIDGDTIETLLGDGRTITVRLIGIDTPE